MRLFITVISLTLFSVSSSAQVGINNVDPNAMLEINASSVTAPNEKDGLLIPRMNVFPPTPNMTADQDGMLIFITGNGAPAKGFYYWNETINSWVNVVASMTAGVSEIDDLLDGKTPFNSVYLGTSAGQSDTGSGFGRNVGLGTQVLEAATGNAKKNTGVGFWALQNNTTGQENTALGHLSLWKNQTGEYNTALGTEALQRKISGNYNIGIGPFAGYQNTTGSYNIFIGPNSGYYETGSNTLYIDNRNANATSALIYGEFGTNNTTAGNILRTNSEFQIGDPAGTGYKFPTSDGGSGQILTTDGLGAMSFVNLPVITDTDNQSIDVLNLNGTDLEISLEDDGVPTQMVDLSGLQDGVGTDDQRLDVLTFSGTMLNISLEDDGMVTQMVDISAVNVPDMDDWNSTGNSATVAGTNFIGTTDAVDFSVRTNNTEKLRITTRGVIETYNRGGGVAIGQGAAANDDLMNRNNVAVGNTALSTVTTGSTNVALGTEAGGSTRGSGNVYLGNEAGASHNGDERLFINNVDGDEETSLVYGLFDEQKIRFNGQIGIRIEPSAFALELRNSADQRESQAIARAWNLYSDSRIKKNQKELVYGLAEILEIQPKSYYQYESVFSDGRLTLVGEGAQDFGFIAQELYSILPDAVNKPINENSTLWTVNYTKVIPVAVKAIQELHKKVEDISEENKRLKAVLHKYELLEERLEALEGSN